MNEKIILKLILFIPFIVVLSTVFAFSDKLANGVLTAKHFWFYLSIGVCAIGMVTHSLFVSNSKIKLVIADLLLLFICLIGLLPFLSGAEAANTHLILMTLLFVLYVYFRITLSFGRVYKYVLMLLVITTALVEGMWGLRQLYGLTSSQHSLFRMTGSFFNPGPYAGYLAVIVPLALYYVFADYKVWTKHWNQCYLLFYIRWILSLLTCMVVLPALPATMSRAAWLAVAGGCGFVACSFLLRKYPVKAYFSTHRKKLLIAIPLMFILMTLCVYGIYQLKKDSADGRALIWKNSVHAIVNHPMGVGMGNFAGAYGDEQIAYFSSGKASEREKLIAGNPEYAFNEYLQIALELGIPGLLLFFSLVSYALYKGICNRLYAPVASLVALLVFAFMSYPFSVLPFLIVFVLLVAVCVTDVQKSGMKGVRMIVVAPLTFLIVAVCLYNRLPVYKAYKDWSQAKVLYGLGLYPEVKEQYESLHPYLQDNPAFLFEYGRILSRMGAYAGSNDVLRIGMKKSCDPMFYNIMGQNFQHLKAYKLAEESYSKAAFMVPHKLYPYYLLTKLYVQTGEQQKALKTTEILMRSNPKVHSPAIDEMRNEIRLLMKDY
ncbi:MAG: O-antigen ligase family protein [Paludibacter sp.]|nr:O-antigen ligase family protein [Paludibacter sp.]